ncbi:MAG: oligosaccharide flippase family protein [Crocinitomicaceae bacterium]|nr:polysaccharide biosynthesis protein [Crocinitomicaceae bacterium]
MSTIKKLAGQTAVYGLSSILGRLLNYLLVPIHTYFFNPSAYGVVSEFYAYVAFFVVLLTFGMETTFFRFVNKAEDKEKTFNQAASFVMIINGIFLLTIIIFSQNIANWMHYPDYQNYVIWFGAILALDATTALFLAKLRFQENAKKFAFVQLASIGVNILFNLIFLFLIYDKEYPDSIGVGYIFLANLLASFAKPVLLFKEVSAFRFVWDKVMAKAMILFAVPLVIAGFAGIINETLDRILIKDLQLDKGLEQAQAQVGIYSANYKLSILITLFIQAFRYAAEPFFFAQESNENKEKVYSKVMTYFIIVVSLIFLVISMNLDIFKWFIPNKDYWEGLKVVPILLLANVCLGIYYNQSIWYKLANKTIYGAYIAIGGAVITIVLNFLLIPIMGYEGSAWTTLAAYASMMVASHYFGQKIYPIKYNLRKAGLYVFSALLFYFIHRLISTDSFTTNTIIAAVFIAIYMGMVFFFEQPLKELRKKQ